MHIRSLKYTDPFVCLEDILEFLIDPDDSNEDEDIIVD